MRICKNLKWYLAFLILTGFSWNVNAQNAVEAAAADYNKHVRGSNEQLLLAGKYAHALFFNGQQKEAMALLQQNISRASKKADGKYGAQLCGIAAMNSKVLDDTSAASSYLKQAKTFAEKTKELSIKGYVMYCEGWMYARNNQEHQAIQSFQQALKFFDKSPQTETVISRKTAIYKELSSIYSNWKAYDLQEKYALLMLEIARSRNKPMDIFDAYMSMGYNYQEQYINHPEQEKLRNLAERYYLQAIHSYQKNKDKMAVPSDLSFAAINLANLYLQFYPGAYKAKSLEYAQLGLEIGEQVEQYAQVASAYGIMAEYSAKAGDQATAKKYLLASLAALMKDAVAENTVALSLYLKLAEVYEAEGQFNEAYHYYKQYVKVYEEVYNANKMEQGRRLEAQFEKERQQQQLIRLRLEAEKRQQQISLMHALSETQQQELKNLKLSKENQRQQMEVIQLEADNRGQELKLSRVEIQQRAAQLEASQKELAYKSRMNIVYVLLIVTLIITACLIYYAYRQHMKTLKQKESLQVLSSMLQGQEAERARLARDLHDGLGGILSGTKITLSALSMNDQKGSINDRSGNLKGALDKSLDQLDVAVVELRRIAHNLMPELLDKYGLKEALKEYALRMSNDGIEVSAHFVNYEDSLEKEKQIVVYRIVQELVNNAVKHADATQIMVQLSEYNNRILITVEDDGKGFDPRLADGRKSAGIHNVQSRLEFLNGNMQIDSRPGTGTTIEIEFPINNEEHDG
ncbi:putative transmembrane protein [Pedobacter sp. BAL39]|uniref:tetratricopeptide repeat-containing sensor histidine kinase n=1 Tax=Pedobacter sp. BAL39 TaxID=391596 RepID=UPI000155A5B5|nr:sensor histidine kinase [Pedobacter sp. BAL39]EDM34219.1 putative transmembrane protein [Pedobacter sp. BAL39]